MRVGASRGPGHDAETLGLRALGALAVFSLSVWLAGGLLALGARGRWREVPIEQAPVVAFRLLARPQSPRRAWPPTVRAALPSSAVTGAATVLVVTVVALACAGALVLARRAPAAARRAVRAGPLPATSGSWASAKDLRALRVPRPTGDRIVLGRHGGHLVAAEPAHSLMVVGPTQSGKTSALAIPAMLEWRGPLLAASVKDDLLVPTALWRSSLGDVRCYDPTATAAATCAQSSGWSPLCAARSWPGAKRMASALCSVARVGGSGMEDAGFWYAQAEKLLAPLLFAAATSGSRMADVVRWLDEGEAGDVLFALELAGVPEALSSARSSLGREERQRASVYATAETIVAAYADPHVAASDRDEIDPAALVSGGSGSLFCCAPARDQERLAPVFTALVREVIDAAFARAAATGTALRPPLLVVLDEAASIAPLAELDRVVATAASHGIQLVTVWQDLAQVEARYGARWATVTNNHRAKLVCSGISDPFTLQHLSGLLGEERQTEQSWTVGGDGRRSRTDALTTRALASPGALRRLPPGEAVLVYGSLPPARIQLRRWFEDEALSKRATSA
jgi:type IV secretion system protein VirD4